MIEKNNDYLMALKVIEISEENLLKNQMQFNAENSAGICLIVYIIAEYEQNSQECAACGKQTLKELLKELTKEFGKGFSVFNIQVMRRFYQIYQNQQMVSVKLSWSHYCKLLTISDDDKRSFN